MRFLTFLFLLHFSVPFARALDECTAEAIIGKLRSKRFTEYTKLKDIPADIREKLKLPKEIADVGSPWSNDCTRQEGIPMNGLRFAAKLDSTWVVLFSSGGYALTNTLNFLCNGAIIPYVNAPFVNSLAELPDKLNPKCFGELSKEGTQECYRNQKMVKD